jgi:hypothetical protein
MIRLLIICLLLAGLAACRGKDQQELRDFDNAAVRCTTAA